MTSPVYREVPKQPGEQVRIAGFDFAPQMESGEFIADAEVTIVDPEGEDVTDDMLVTDSVEIRDGESVDDSVVVFEVKDGEHNLDYVATVIADVSGRPLHGEIILPVRERPH